MTGGRPKTLEAKVAAYGRQAIELGLRGLAHVVPPSSTRAKLLEALGTEFARIDERFAVLLAESDPRTTAELLPEWENAFGLPGACTALAPSTILRRFALVAKLTSTGGQSASYFVDVAKDLGFTIVVDEQMPFVCGRGRVGPGGTFNGITFPDGRIYNGADLAKSWAFAWTIRAPAVSPVFFRAGQGAAGDALVSHDNSLLECTMTELKPAHTHLIFKYDQPTDPTAYAPWEEVQPTPAVARLEAPNVIRTTA